MFPLPEIYASKIKGLCLLKNLLNTYSYFIAKILKQPQNPSTGE